MDDVVFDGKQGSAYKKPRIKKSAPRLTGERILMYNEIHTLSVWSVKSGSVANKNLRC